MGLLTPFLMKGAETLMTPKPPKPPVLESPKPMPEIDDEKIMLTKKRSIVAQQQRDGRASTMLSDSYDKLG